MVKGVYFHVVLIGHLGRCGMGLVVVLNEVPAAAEHEFDRPAVLCESRALRKCWRKMDLHVPWSMLKN